MWNLLASAGSALLKKVLPSAINWGVNKLVHTNFGKRVLSPALMRQVGHIVDKTHAAIQQRDNGTTPALPYPLFTPSVAMAVGPPRNQVIQQQVVPSANLPINENAIQIQDYWEDTESMPGTKGRIIQKRRRRVRR